ncbi:hypothetical protein DFH28DRAFT_88422 [Melampsora americana]|nr:hypothetical protein DFH28DRAFT_88422 [Melampsora americana]
MKGLKNIHLSTKFIQVLFILLSLSSVSFGGRFIEEVEILPPKFEDIPPPTGDGIWVHWNLGQALKLTNMPHDETSRSIMQKPAVARYLKSIENLVNVVGENPSKIFKKEANEISELFKDSDMAKKAWVSVNFHYNRLHTSMSSIKGGKKWLERLDSLEGMYKSLIMPPS